MTITGPGARSAALGQAVVDAAMLLLERMGLTPADLPAAPAARPAAPTLPSTSRSSQPWPATAAAGRTARTGTGVLTRGGGAAQKGPTRRGIGSPATRA